MAYDMTLPRSAPAPASGVIVQLEARARDYDRMARALAWLADNWREHPSLDEAADAVGLSPFHFQRVFTRWAGVSPKAFVASIAHAEARTPAGGRRQRARRGARHGPVRPLATA